MEQDILGAGGICIALDTNFRSQSGLIALCNELFGQLFQDDQGVTFSPIKGRKSCLETKEYLEWLVLAKQKITAEDSARSAEANMIARRLRQMVDEQERHIFNESTQQLCPVSYGDIAILFRSFTDVSVYEKALQSAGVPYYVVGARGFYGCQEILDVLALLRVVDNCYNEVAWAGLLRSPFFLMDDSLILMLKAGRRSIWAGLQAVNRCRQPGITLEQHKLCQRVWVIINELRAAKEFLLLPELLDKALQLTNYREFLLSQFMGKQQAANVDKLLSMAAQQADRGGNLHDFLIFIDEILQEDVQEGEAQIESEAGDTVKLLTIHKSKGLEYPVVVLPDLQRKFTISHSKIFFDKNIGLGLSTASCTFGENRVFSLLRKQQQQLERLELKRLLYVAQTRAKDYLVLTSVADDAIANDYNGKNYSELDSWHKWLTKLSSDSSLTAKVGILADCPVTDEFVAADEQKVEIPLPSYVEQNLAVVGAQVPGSLPVFSASMFSRYYLCPRAYYYRYVAHIPELSITLAAGESGNYQEWSEDSAEALVEAGNASLLGTVVHKFIELYQSGSVEEILDVALKKTVKPSLRPQLKKAAWRMCHAYVDDQLFDRTKELYSEWPFAFDLTDQQGERFYFRGIVDKIINDDEGLRVVDFKTDQVKSDEFAVKMTHYACQIKLYTLAVEKLLQIPVSQAAIYFLRPGRFLPVVFAPTQDFVTPLLNLCRFLTTHYQEADYSCSLDSCHYCNFRLFCPRQ